MLKTLTIISPILFWMIGQNAQAQHFEFQVEHRHALRSCHGTLTITSVGITYRTNHKQDNREWKYTDIRSIKLVAPALIEITTYESRKRMLGRDRVFEFKLLKGEIAKEVSALLVAKAARPVATNVLDGQTSPPLFSIPVKHLHLFGGCGGTLNIYPDRVDFLSSDNPKDSRSWRYLDFDGFAHFERFRLEFIAYEQTFGGSLRTYTFELRADLPSQAEKYIRQKLAEQPLKSEITR